jgi:hypothetical protein
MASMWRWLIVAAAGGLLVLLASCGDDEEQTSPLDRCEWVCLASPANPDDCHCHRAYVVDGGCGELPEYPTYTLVQSCPERPCCITYREQPSAEGDESEACDCYGYLPEGCALTVGVMQEGDLGARIVPSCPPP